MLAAAWSLCEDFEGVEGKDCEIEKELFISQDMGETWKMIATYVV